MKKFCTILVCLICFMGFEINSDAQSLVVSGKLFLPQDSIGFTYKSPSFSSTDWIGIYHVGDAPGGPTSVAWNYIPADTGILYLQAPDEAGDYKAFLLCCDGYDTIAISTEFRIAIPFLTASSSIYTQGDSMVFSYVSPKFSSSDWIGIYPSGTKPGAGNPSIDWKYIPDSAGTLTFKTSLDSGKYDVYLLCCGGYDSISACSFEVKSANTPFVAPKSAKFPAGSPIEITFNDPSYATGDWIGLYFSGDDPALVSSVVWSNISSKTGAISFPGTLSGGSYFAVLFCCGTSETIYAQSTAFTVEAGASGTYVKTAASVYPEGVKILVNYRNPDFKDKDWIAIYNKGDAPGGPPSIDYQYTAGDSGTLEFTTVLTPGEYVVYLLCCDGYQIKAKYDFKIANATTPSLVASSLTYAGNDSLVFYYNSPSYVSTDWIGIYNPGDVPGDIGSITWQYIPVSSGTLVFHYPDQHSLVPGEYWAGLFCCDGYDLYAQTSFVVTTAAPAGINKIHTSNKMNLYPNPSNGMISVKTVNEEGFLSITVYSITGQALYKEKISGMTKERTLDLRFLNKGIYFINARTEKSSMTAKLIIQ